MSENRYQNKKIPAPLKLPISLEQNISDLKKDFIKNTVRKDPEENIFRAKEKRRVIDPDRKILHNRGGIRKESSRLNVQDLGKQVDTIEPNRLFSLKLSIFFIVLGFFGVYRFFYGSGSAKMSLFVSAIAFGLAVFFLSGIKKNWVRIYENGIMVNGIFTRSGIFGYDEIEQMKIESRKSGFPAVNVGVYDSADKMITGMNSFFYKDLPEKVDRIEKIKASRKNHQVDK